MSDYHQNPIYQKSFAFANRVIRLYEYLTTDEKYKGHDGKWHQKFKRKEYIVSKQLVRSGTSIVANVKEGLRGQSKADFAAKMSIANKEANESETWLELLQSTQYLTDAEAESMLQDCRELCKMLAAICKTAYNDLSKH